MVEWFHEQERYTDYLMSRSSDERLAMLRGFYHLEQLGAQRLPELAHWAPDASFQQETLAHAADEARHEVAFRDIILRVGGNVRDAAAPPYSIGAQLIEKALVEWQHRVTPGFSLSTLASIMVYLRASEERAIISFAAHAQGYRHDTGITQMFARIISDEKQHVRMIRRRLACWRRDDRAVGGAIAQAEEHIQAIYDQSTAYFDSGQ